MKKRVLSLLLTVMMIAGLIPFDAVAAATKGDLSIDVKVGTIMVLTNITIKDVEGTVEKSDNANESIVKLTEVCDEIQITLTAVKNSGPANMPISLLTYSINGDKAVNFTAKNMNQGYADIKLIPKWDEEGKYVAKITIGGPSTGTHTLVFETPLTPKYFVEEIALNKEAADVFVGEDMQLSASVLPEMASQKVEWSTEDASIATVSKDGIVTGKKAGTTTITATTKDKTENGKTISANCVVTVKNVDVTGVILNKTETEIGMGSAETLTATIAPENATVKDVVWTSSDSDVASVDKNGAVTGKKVGVATIMAKSVYNEECFAECKVTVKKIEVTGISLDKITAEIEVGKKDTLTATVAPENASIKDIVWISSDSSIASVDEKGNVTGVEEGTVTITATSSDNEDVYAQCQVTVKRIYVTGIKLNKESTEIEIGKKGTLTATITPENATVKDVVWMSSDPSVAVVDKEGRVTGVSLGEATIFAVAKGRDVNGNMLTASCDVTVVEEREVLVPTVIYTNGVEGTGWPYKSAYINTITINGANVKSYSWSGDTCNVLLSNKTMQDAEFEMSITKGGSSMYFDRMTVKLNGSTISTSGTITLENGKAENIPLYVDGIFKKGTKYFNFTVAEPNNIPTLVDRTKIETEATVTGREGYSLNLGKLFTDADEGDVLTYNLSVDGGESETVTVDENGVYTYPTDVPGTYTLVFTATDSKEDTSKDTYTVTLTVVNSTETYEAAVNIPDGIEPVFYINDGFDVDGYPVNAEELSFEKGESADGSTRYVITLPDNIEMINIFDGKRTIAVNVSADSDVSLREVDVKATDKFDNPVEGTISVAYDGHSVLGKDNRYMLVAENEYTLTATPKDTTAYKVGTIDVKIENGIGIAEINAKVEFNNLKTITAPTGADVRLYRYNKYYDNTEFICRGSEAKDEKTSIYYFSGVTIPAGGGTLIYRVKYEDYAVKAGWTTSNVTVTFGENDPKVNTTVDYGSSADSNKEIADDGVLLNINGQNNLALSVGGSKTLKAYRAWEIIPVSYNNNIITPDFHYNIISGSDVVQLTDKASLSTTDTDWKTLTALKEGVAIIEVSYDAITVSGGQSWNGTYGASDPARTGLMVVQVGGHDSSVKFGIDCFASKGSTTYNAANAREWDTEFDTLYFTGSYGELKLSPKASSEITEVAVSNDKGSGWTILDSANGVYTAKIVHGNNIVRVTTESGSAYQVVRGGKVTYSVVETVGDGDGLIEAGETVRVILKGLHSPIPKMAGNYNPGYKANNDGDSSVHIKYTVNDNTVSGKGVQYTFGADGNYIDLEVPEDYSAGTIDLINGYIGLGVIGLRDFVDGGDSHRNIPDVGCATRASESTFHTRSMLPNISLVIGEAASENTPPEVKAGAIKKASVKYGQTFAINPETLFTDADGNKLTYSVSVDGAEKKTVDAAFKFEPEAEGEYVLTFAASDGRAEATHSISLTVTKAEDPDDGELVFDISGNEIKGYVAVSFEDNGVREESAVGLKYPTPLGDIVPETKVPYAKGDTIADVTLRLLDAMDIGYEYSGTTKSGFYLGVIKNFVVDNVPYDKMGEFDAGSGSGWMITHNDVFIGAGASEFTVKEGDKVVWKYTCQLGADIGDPFYAKDVDDVIALIDGIGEVTLDSAGKVAAARAAYESLDDVQKKKVINYDKLVEAEKTLAELMAGVQRLSYEEAYNSTGDYLAAAAEKITPVVNSTGGDWIIVGLERSGRETPADYYDNVAAYVKEKANDKEQLHASKSTENSRVILALTAAGIDPTDVEGHNLLEGLTDMSYLKKQGINGPIWALIAFDSHDYAIPEGGDVTREALIKEILYAQLEDGGWDLAGNVADSDMTGMALQSLAPYYSSDKTVKKAVDKALSKLSAIQNADGTFGSIDGPSAESCAQVIVALTALGIDPASDSRFVKNGLSVVDGLLVFAMEDGGFRHIVNGQLDGMATEQGYYALVAYDRFIDGKTSLYNMSDVKLAKGEVGGSGGSEVKPEASDKNQKPDNKETTKGITKSISGKLKLEKVTKEQLAKGRENHYCEETGVDARDNSNDILPWYVKLNAVKQEATDEQKTAVSEALGGDGELFVLKDIHFTNTKDGSEWQPTKPIKVKMPMVDIGDYEKAIIVHITDDGKMEFIKGTVKDGMIEFEADSFSLYGIVGTNTSINELLTVEDDGEVIWPWILIGIIALAAVVYLAYRRKREA